MLLIGPVFALIGVVLLVATVVKFVRARASRSRMLHAKGTVLGFRSGRGRRGQLHFPLVSFVAHDGTAHEIEASVGTSFRHPPEGRQVELCYPRDSPERADLDSPLTRWFEIALFGFMGCSFTVLGILLTVVFWLAGLR